MRGLTWGFSKFWLVWGFCGHHAELRIRVFSRLWQPASFSFVSPFNPVLSVKCRSNCRSQCRLNEGVENALAARLSGVSPKPPSSAPDAPAVSVLSVGSRSPSPTKARTGSQAPEGGLGDAGPQVHQQRVAQAQQHRQVGGDPLPRRPRHRRDGAHLPHRRRQDQEGRREGARRADLQARARRRGRRLFDDGARVHGAVPALQGGVRHDRALHGEELPGRATLGTRAPR